MIVVDLVALWCVYFGIMGAVTLPRLLLARHRRHICPLCTATLPPDRWALVNGGR